MLTLKKLLITFCFGFTAFLLHAQNVSPDPAYKLLTAGSVIQCNNYYLLTLLQENKEARRLIESDPLLSSFAKKKQEKVSASLQECTGNATCFTGKMKFSEEEIKEVSDRLISLYTDNNALGKLVTHDLIPSGTYLLFAQSTPKQLLAQAWEQDAKGINFTIGVYGEGLKANYPNIDSVSLPVHSSQYAGFVYTAAYLLAKENQDNHLFFSLPLASALHFLEMNERDNAADYEPMMTTVNKPAYDKIKTVKWDAYKYSVLLVPGAGPEEPEVALSAEGMLRCRFAALQYAKGLAPFIVVSGGKVHPYKTKYNEALEMKKFLTDNLHIPENAVIVEPHARHTTTNMRNCARLIFRYGIPFTKPCLAVTSRAQSASIFTTLPDRCQRELHEIPYRNGLRLSETETEFFPLIQALHINPSEPMDP